MPTTPEPPAIPTSRPVRPPVVENTAIMRITARAFTPMDMARARVRLPAPSCWIMSITSDCQSRMLWATSCGNSGGSAARSRPASSTCPAGSSRQRRSESSAARAVFSTTTACRPVSMASSTRTSGAGRPVKNADIRSRTRPIPASRPRKNSPVPTKSCQRASTSPRSSVPSRVESTTARSASSNAVVTSRRRCSSVCSWAAVASAVRSVVSASSRTAPPSVRAAMSERA